MYRGALAGQAERAVDRQNDGTDGPGEREPMRAKLRSLRQIAGSGTEVCLRDLNREAQGPHHVPAG
jgi:hypothetical protein